MTPVYKALLLNEPMMHDRPSCESPSSPSWGAQSTEELQSSYGSRTVEAGCRRGKL